MSDDAHILSVDDEPGLCAVLKEYLSSEGYQISVAHDGSQMRRGIEQSPVDLVLLDVGLPREDGLTLARSLRAENPGIAIIMLTARGDTIDRIVGLELGADDYLAKPFQLRELLARIRSIRRRAEGPAAKHPDTEWSRVRFAGWLFDRLARELFSPAGESIRLTSGEFDLLAAFVAHPNQLLTRDRLLDLVGDRRPGPFDRTVDVQVGRLRRKLNDDPKQPHLIKTLRSAGYMFTALVTAAADRAPTSSEK